MCSEREKAVNIDVSYVDVADLTAEDPHAVIVCVCERAIQKRAAPEVNVVESATHKNYAGNARIARQRRGAFKDASNVFVVVATTKQERLEDGVWLPGENAIVNQDADANPAKNQNVPAISANLLNITLSVSLAKQQKKWPPFPRKSGRSLPRPF